MQQLLLEAHKYTTPEVSMGNKVDMRCIEHSLCEFDKYMRVKEGTGTPRSLYRRPK
jgi:hypothetical protein